MGRRACRSGRPGRPLGAVLYIWKSLVDAASGVIETEIGETAITVRARLRQIAGRFYFPGPAHPLKAKARKAGWPEGGRGP